VLFLYERRRRRRITKRDARAAQQGGCDAKVGGLPARSAASEASNQTHHQPLTAPMVKPAINRSRNRLNTNAIGSATRTVAA
jgi:hypothetical protein